MLADLSHWDWFPQARCFSLPPCLTMYGLVSPPYWSYIWLVQRCRLCLSHPTSWRLHRHESFSTPTCWCWESVTATTSLGLAHSYTPVSQSFQYVMHHPRFKSLLSNAFKVSNVLISSRTQFLARVSYIFNVLCNPDKDINFIHCTSVLMIPNVSSVC